MRRARSRLRGRAGLLVAGACAVLAAASCFPDYTFLPADATLPDGGDGATSGPDATAEGAVDGPGADTRVPDGTTPEDAPPDAPPPESGPTEAAPPDASDGGAHDSGPPDLDGGMVAITGGAFDFIVRGPGSVHATLDYSFEIDAKEVTVARFKAWVGAGMPVPCAGPQPCALDGTTPYASAMVWNPAWNTLAQSLDYTGNSDCQGLGGGDVATYTLPASDAYPVTCVNWAQAAAFCWSDKKRLPTTTEWYYVATAAGANASNFPWGAAMPDCSSAIFNYAGNTCGYPLAVGTARAQVSGVYDLAGDVSEWTWDAVDQDAGLWYPPDATDYAGIAYDGSVDNRNSFWISSSYNTGPQTLDSVASAGPEPQWGWADLGFRCARTR
jgi:formylglycine-generating enzyme required for sulfatase activity